MFAVHRGRLAADFLPAGFVISCNILVAFISDPKRSLRAVKGAYRCHLHACINISTQCFLYRSDKKQCKLPFFPPPHQKKKSLIWRGFCEQGYLGPSWEDSVCRRHDTEASLSIRLVSFWSMQIHFDLVHGVPCAKKKPMSRRERVRVVATERYGSN